MNKTKLNAVISDLKSFDWKQVIDYGNNLGPKFNNAQWRFMKGLIMEKATESYSNDPTFKYVGEKHCDFTWEKHNITIEQKSIMAGKFYTKKNKLKKTLNFILTNSQGTNNSTKISSISVADVLIGISSDGVVFAPNDVVMRYLTQNDDGYVVNIPGSEIVEITGYLEPGATYENNLYEVLITAMEENLMKENDRKRLTK
jgi:hypothetical protein